MKTIPAARSPRLALVFAFALSATAQQPAAPVAAASPAGAGLLEIAWRAASSYPTVPHQRRRVRAQMRVVDALFELGRLDQALAWGRTIEGHRRGEVLADHVYHLALRGEGGDAARQRLDHAERIVRDAIGKPDVQDWQCHLGLLKIARAHRALGDAERADRIAAGVPASSGTAVDPEWDRVAMDVYRRADRAEAERMLAGFDAGYSALSLGAQQTSLAGLLHLHGRFFADVELRTKIETLLLRLADEALPDQHFGALIALVETHAANAQQAAAQRFADLARAQFDRMQMRPEQRIANLAAMARVRALAGDRQWARAIATEATVAWQDARESASQQDRGDVLRSLAWAWSAVGEKVQADDLLQLAMNATAANPNARPRCEELVETCIELVRRGIEPSPRLVALIREIGAGLGDPW
jgi:hypothetical protein